MSKVCVAFLATLLCIALPTRSEGQTARKPVITGPIDSGATVVLPGTKHPLAQPRFDVGAVDAGLKMTRVMLVLSPAKDTASQLQTLLDHQQDRTSADYHRWLTPEQFGQQFGPAPEDIAAVQGWLTQQGLQVTSIAKSGLWMEFSGTSAQIERAFQTKMRQYQVSGEMHIANSTDLSIPAALAPAVQGVASLHNFFKKSSIGQRVQAKANSQGSYTVVTPNVTLAGGVHAITPGDYAKIYQLSPLYNASLNGAGIQIGLVARNDISISDYNDFRTLTNLPPGNVANVLTLPPDPGFDDTSGDTVEATLDSQWAGGVAPGASIKVVVSSSTITTDGVDLSSAFAVDNNLTDILSVSFGQCEASIGLAENAFFNSLWQQAAAQGISVFVSSGDSGAAGCDPAESNTAAQGGLAVSGLASTPFNTAVGGTEFNEAGLDGNFWSAGNAPGGVSAAGYIPEEVWNETCNPLTAGSPCAGQGFFLDAGSGGRSTIYPKPTWQAGFPAAPADTSRDIPDVSLSAANHDGYVICFDFACESGLINIVGGTSASSPSFAGIMAIVDQALGGRQGLPNYALYRLARNASASCSSSARVAIAVPAPAGCIFNDVTVGNNSVPGQAGFNATSGYDLATGLGSVNAANLVNAWRALSTAATTTTLSSSASPITVVHGQAVPIAVSVTGTSAPAPSGAVSLSSSVSGPVGAVALTAASTTVGSFTGNVSNLPGGTYSLIAHYPGDSQNGPSDSGTLSVTVTPEASVTTLTALGISPQGFAVPSTSFSYGSFLGLQASVAGTSGQGIPSGTITFQDSTSGQALGSSPLNLRNDAEIFIFPNNVSPAPLTVGSHALTASYSGDSSFNANTNGASTITVTKGVPSVVVNPVNSAFISTQAGNLSVVVTPSGPIPATGTLQLLDGGVPLGAPITIAGSQTVFSATFTNEGQHSITASYSGDATYLAEVSPAQTVNVIAPFLFLGTINQTVAAGQTATYNLELEDSNIPATFAGTVTMACSGAPAGATCTVNPTSFALSPTQNITPITVTVTTSTTTAGLHAAPFRGLAMLLGGAFAILVLGKSKKRRQHLQIVAVLALAAFVSSCGGGGGGTPVAGAPTPVPTPTPTPSTTHTLVLTGTSGTHVTTTNLTLVVTH
jgi:hypothetical protein